MTGLALRWGKEPSVVWARAKRKPKDYRLLFAYMEWEHEETEAMFEKAKDQAKTKRRR